MRRPAALLPLTFLLLTALIIAGYSTAMAQETTQEDDWTEVQGLLNQGKTEEAIAAIEVKLETDPENGLAWYMLASAHHVRGEYVEAAEANAKAAEFDATVRESALYNRACALTLLGDLEGADVALSKALDAGFADFDLLFTDSDLQALREANRVELPPSTKYESFEGRDGVKFGYAVLLPEGYKSGRELPVIVAFGPGGSGIFSTDWARAHLWGSDAQRKDAIVVVAYAPRDGWINHPAHHALNGLLAKLLGEYEVEGGKFHMVGYRGGTRIAATYASMSKEYFLSLTLFSGDPFIRWDDSNLGSYPMMPMHFVYGNSDEAGKIAALRSRERFGEYGRQVMVTALPGEGPLMTGLWDAKLLVEVQKTIDMARKVPR